MSKSFKQAPKPALITPDQISAFEKGGLGHDTRLREPVLAAPAEPTKRLSLDLPVSKHTRFKTAIVPLARNGGRPLAITYSTLPRLNRSAR